MTQADRYKALVDALKFVESKLFADQWMLNINPESWIIFKDGSKYNMTSGGTINPGDIIV